MHIYEEHMGGLFVSKEPLNYEALYCEICGDSDYELGTANTVRDALWLVVDSRYGIEYVKKFIDREFWVDLKIPATKPNSNAEIQEIDGEQKLFCHTCGHICSIIRNADEWKHWEPDWCWDCAELWMQEIEKLNSEDVLNTCYEE